MIPNITNRNAFCQIEINTNPCQKVFDVNPLAKVYLTKKYRNYNYKFYLIFGNVDLLLQVSMGKIKPRVYNPDGK